MGYGIAARKCFAKLVCTIAAMAVAVIPLSSQVATSQKPSFEVSSVKPNASRVNGGPITATGTGFLATNVTLRTLVTYAYRQPTDQFLEIIGAPSWIDSDRFDVEGKPASDDRAIPPPQLALMVQALLEDRFALRLHREQKEVPIFILSVGKDGPRFKLSEDQSEYGAAPLPPPQRPAARHTDSIWSYRSRTTDLTAACAAAWNDSKKWERPDVYGGDLVVLCQFSRSTVRPSGY